MSTGACGLRRTPLYAQHVMAGGRLVSFAGWEMPLEYQGIQSEHSAVRAAAGIFDVSHMGRVEIRGPDSEALLQRLLSNDLSKVAVGGAQYSVLCRPDGGVLDDLFTYRLDDARYLTITNASNHRSDLQWLREHANGFDVVLDDVTERYAMLAVQGPDARRAVGQIAESDLPARMRASWVQVAGMPCLVCATGYTGEDGIEILAPAREVPGLWQALLERDVVPAGLGARDTLRLEMGYHLYGNDLSAERGPIEAGLGWCCKEETNFIGSEAVAAARGDGPSEKLVAFTMPAGGIARPGNPVLGGGTVTSGTFSPSMGLGIGMAYVPAELGAEGSTLTIDVRGKTREALVVGKPIYRRGDG
jgi:glycine cleavage system T protein (aminomethyltransferase)